ncbi:transcription initiation factor IIB [Candidatus Marsarchaeota G2 archaeon ECH_B_SAG-F08]|jgi:transcription initiation factor TFIIB|uniref:Transcription initiation factor IIB n=5 Tax=Candidatus Marsarchaeota TaxID=1978152 RepID=A0A2R6AI17_9ARCH|nr:MAG: transcription initiation factor IIB [Candidatus Marsarchaeota G1 archaeon OSP_D]PSN85969.1 MAG: transcription initiation factor IIB [Candidatus Marsarchaeota G1 archaeon BE_D]PSN88458.1 MAG: transcription initiation factor IIB [Candidatus Marsarchaeota G1 archaeon OSP_C]PSN98080.1 MAG: transcription initiation factor IIB [Candidatus Marsarchaeota G2 archaeon ECH_B_SAG-F08]PSO04821.1 MAG: transcription initiation factor IIB [Candidatus Marsarchaeota G2 archaeon ECH_B_SAG-G16]
MSEEKIEGKIVCPTCGSENIIYSSRGELVCDDCGTVISERSLDFGQEWRAFTAEEREKRSRTGEPLKPGMTTGMMSTIIDKRDINRLKLDAQRRVDALQMRKWQMRSRFQTARDRSTSQALAEINRIATPLKLPESVKEEAATIYQKAVDAGLVRGRSIESIVAATLYVACRKFNLPISLDQITQYTKNQNKKDVARCYRLLVKDLNIIMPVPDPVSYIPRIASKLGLDEEAQKKAEEIIRKAQQNGITAGKDPAGLAAAAIYVVSLLENNRKTQREIASAAEVTEVTVRNRYKELVEKLKLIPMVQDSQVV